MGFLTDMDLYITVSFTLSTLIYQEGGKDICLHYDALRATATLNILTVPNLSYLYYLDGLCDGR